MWAYGTGTSPGRAGPGEDAHTLPSLPGVGNSVSPQTPAQDPAHQEQTSQRPGRLARQSSVAGTLGRGGRRPMKSWANSSIVRSVPSAPTRATGGSVTSSEHSPSPGVSSGAHRRPCGRVLRATLPATPNRKAHMAISGGSGSAGRQCGLSHSGGWQPPLTPGWCHQEPGRAASTSS